MLTLNELAQLSKMDIEKQIEASLFPLRKST